MKNIFLILFFLFAVSYKINCQNEEIVFPLKHSSTLTSLKYSHDRSFIATTSNDWTIKLWYASNSILLRTFVGHHGAVLNSDFSFDNKYLVSGSTDSSIIIWDITNGKKVFEPLNLGNKVLTVCFNPNNKSVFAGTNSGKIYEINILTGKIERELTYPQYKITQLAFNKNSNKLLASLSKNDKNEDSELEINSFSSLIQIDLSNDKKPFVISNYKENVSNFCFNPDSEKIVTAAENGMVRVWNAISFIEEISFKNTNLIPGYVFVSGNGKMIGVTSQKDNTINIWRISGEKLFDFTFDQGKTIYGEFNTDITRIHLCNNIGKFLIYDLNAREREIIGNYLQSESILNTMVLSPLSGKIALGYKNGVIKAFDLSTSLPINITTPQSSNVHALCFSNDEKKICVSYDQSVSYDEYSPDPIIGYANISILETASGLRVRNIVFNKDYSTALTSFGNNVVSGFNNGVIKFYDINTGKELYNTITHDYDILDIYVTEDEKWLATSSIDATVKVWKLEGLKLIRTNTFQFNQEVTNVKYILTLKTLICSSRDRELTIIPNLISENAIKINLPSEVSGLDVSEKDSLFFTSFSSGQTECTAYSILSGKEKWSFKKVGSKIMNIVYSKKYNVIFCGLENGSIILLNPINGKEMATLVILKNYDWLVYTPDNYFDASISIYNGINIINNLSIADRSGVEKFHKKDLLNTILNKE
jgi:WD40 repeat protein